LDEQPVAVQSVVELPAALRCFVGCAAKLHGDIDTADLVKIHIMSGKPTLLFYDDFSKFTIAAPS
jgi:hypothetical protein